MKTSLARILTIVASANLLFSCSTFKDSRGSTRAPASACLEGYLFTAFGCLPKNSCPQGQADLDGSCVEAKAPQISVSEKPVALESTLLKTPEEVIGRLIAIETKLYATSGFQKQSDIVSAAQKTGGAMAQAADLLMNEKLEVALAITSARRDTILKSGFLNFRQTNGSASSGGAARGREPVEGNYIGIYSQAYAGMDAELKPKSAYLSPLPGSGLTAPMSIAMYGDDHFIFKLDAIRNRTSLTAGDSLNRRYASVGNADDLTSPLFAWDQVYVPWSQRELLIPLLATGIAEKRLGVQMHVNYLTAEEVESRPSDVQKSMVPLAEVKDPKQKIPWTTIDMNAYQGTGLFQNYRAQWAYSLDYIEAQIWGRLAIDDVAAFEFTKTPPSGQFLAELQKRNIQIRDLRKKK